MSIKLHFFRYLISRIITEPLNYAEKQKKLEAITTIANNNGCNQNLRKLKESTENKVGHRDLEGSLTGNTNHVL
jgi:hypothetical protein